MLAMHRFRVDFDAGAAASLSSELLVFEGTLYR
jgi:hypothetical protein